MHSAGIYKNTKKKRIWLRQEYYKYITLIPCLRTISGGHLPTSRVRKILIINVNHAKWKGRIIIFLRVVGLDNSTYTLLYGNRIARIICHQSYAVRGRDKFFLLSKD